jgi:hypothetical protein
MSVSHTTVISVIGDDWSYVSWKLRAVLKGQRNVVRLTVWKFINVDLSSVYTYAATAIRCNTLPM